MPEPLTTEERERLDAWLTACVVLQSQDEDFEIVFGRSQEAQEFVYKYENSIIRLMLVEAPLAVPEPEVALSWDETPTQIKMLRMKGIQQWSILPFNLQGMLPLYIAI